MTASSNDRLTHLLDRWEEAAERGEDLQPEQLCEESPELLSELTRQITALRLMDGRLKLDRQHSTLPRHHGKSDTAAIHRSVASYSQLQVLAQGGLGIVYRATDGELHREVVLKFIHRHIAGSDEHRAMFRREAEVTSRLDHPGVVPVYGIGEAGDGCAFYVMRYIQGETLGEAIDRLHAGDRRSSASSDSLELRNLLGRFVAICKTIAYAHNRGIIHRDIKPANIMLGRYGETLVVDWGLAIPVGRDERFKHEDEKTLMPSDSSSGANESGAGTPAYMSPEAVSNDCVLTPATDIYGLGAMLYKLLTGKTPFEGIAFHQFRKQVLNGDFPPPSKVKRTVSKALEAICLKAMANDPRQRYPTALELAAEVENYLADEPVAAYQEPLPRRAARWARRHRSLAQTILVGVSVLSLVTVLSAVWLGYLANSEREARLAAEAAKQQSLRMSAKFAARTVAGQIDLRWRILEAAAKDAAIRDALLQINESPQDLERWSSAQAWLNDQYIQLQNDHAIEFNSLFLLDAQGTQVARAPKSDSSIGRSYAYRDYFHGRGMDLKETEGEIEPIQNVNLSATYSSSTSGKMKVAFTVPISSGNAIQHQVIGVVGMSVDLGGFGILETDLQSGQIVVLVDSRMDSVEGEPRRGLILQHPDLAQAEPRQQAVQPSARMDEASLERIRSAEGPFLLQGYQDPLRSGSWVACCESVMVDGRRSPVADTGWMVLVQEPSFSGKPPAPASALSKR